MSHEQVGNIRNQVGHCLMQISINIEQQDVAGVGNFVRLLRALAFPVLMREPDLRAELEAITPGPSYGDAFEAEMRKVEIILQVLSEHNLYAYKDVGLVDATGIWEEDGQS